MEARGPTWPSSFAAWTRPEPVGPVEFVGPARPIENSSQQLLGERQLMIIWILEGMLHNHMAPSQ